MDFLPVEVFGLCLSLLWCFFYMYTFQYNLKCNCNRPGFLKDWTFYWCVKQTLEKCLKMLYNSAQVIISQNSSTGNNYYKKQRLIGDIFIVRF